VPFIRRAKHNVDAAPVRLPTRYRRPEVIVGVLDTPVVFFFVLVFGRPRSGVPAQPELLDKMVALLISPEPSKDNALQIVDDLSDIFI